VKAAEDVIIVRVISRRLKSAKDYFEQGDRFSDLKKYSDAIRYYEKAIKIQSYYPDAYYNMGFAYKNLGNHERATACFAKAEEQSNAPDNAGAIYHSAAQKNPSTLISSTAVRITPAKADVQINNIPIPVAKPDHVKSKSSINCVIL
jgi:tetratricopeptide (TPR) repeat protein